MAHNPPDWDEVRAHLNTLGMAALEDAVAEGVPRELAGQRIADFNDRLVVMLQEQFGEQGEKP